MYSVCCTPASYWAYIPTNGMWRRLPPDTSGTGVLLCLHTILCMIAAATRCEVALSVVYPFFLHGTWTWESRIVSAVFSLCATELRTVIIIICIVVAFIIKWVVLENFSQKRHWGVSIFGDHLARLLRLLDIKRPPDYVWRPRRVAEKCYSLIKLF